MNEKRIDDLIGILVKDILNPSEPKSISNEAV
jgi:hypothetical protein